MDAYVLSELLEDPQILSQVLGKYRGPYHIGVGADPCYRTQEFVILLQVPDLRQGPFPTEIEIDGETVFIVAQENLTPPTPYNVEAARQTL